MRNPDTTKHDYGHALLVAGAYGRCGCAILAARAAMRCGCGLLTVHLPQRCVDAMQTAFPEAMVSIDPCDKIFSMPPEMKHYTAIAAGPGLGIDETTQEALLMLLEGHPSLPLVLDADALNILAIHPEWLPLASGAVVTPHAREYQRLFGDADPAEMAREHNIIIVKKSHHTHVYAPDGRVYENVTGNAGMATAGSGDVLTGILLGIIAQNHSDLFDSVCLGVRVHGKIADNLIAVQSESSLVASDIVEGLKDVSIELTTS